MGTAITIDVRSDLEGDALEVVIDDAFGWLRWVDDTFSIYKPDSQVSRLDRGDLALRDCHPMVLAVLERCEALRDFTHGYFDARARGDRALDPSGLVKGWAVEQASELLAAARAVNHCVNAGGDVALRGTPREAPLEVPGPRGWRVGIVHPLEPGALTSVVAISDGAIATSGTYERGMHVFDPHTGLPATGLASVSVVGPSLALADAYATAALAMGSGAAAWLGGLEGYESHVMDAGGHVWLSAGFAGYQVL